MNSSRRTFLTGAGALALGAFLPGDAEQKVLEYPVLDTTDPFTAFTVGHRGRLIYTLSWNHESVETVKASRDELMQLITLSSQPASLALEGFAAGESIDLSRPVNKVMKPVVDYARNAGIDLFGGDNKPLLDDVTNSMHRIMREGGYKSKKEICDIFRDIMMKGRQRTQTLLETLLELKNSRPNNLVVGMMGDDHFTLADRDILEDFADQHDVTIVAHVINGTENRAVPQAWPERHCGLLQVK